MKVRSGSLGSLELAVLDRLWSDGPADVAAMHASVGAARGLASNTIQSTLERLFRKGLAERRKVGRAFEYRARKSRAEWLTESLSGLLDAAPGADAELMLAAFVDLAERSGSDSLDALEALVQRRRRERGGES
jgi:predicted transcriptional regulator